MTDTMMRAVLQDSAGDESTMYVGSTEVPEPGNQQVVIKVHATALNQMDLLQRKGLYPLPPDASKILGVEVAGYVHKLGPNCTSGLKVGDRCMALLQGGGYAEYAVSHECTVMPAPTGLSMATLAAIPEQWITAHQLLFFVANMQEGESVLLHAGSSGVGQAAIQMATRRGIRCFCTCRDDAKVQCCLDMGAVAAFNIRDRAGDFSALVKAANNGAGVDVVLDPVAGSYASENIEVLARDGRWVLYGCMGGKAVHDDAFLGKLLAKRITLVASTLRGRDYAYKRRLVKSCAEEALPHIANGTFRVLIDSEFEMTTEGVQQAHRRMGGLQNIGKIVVNVLPDDGAAQNKEDCT